jgi:hypothetical protein
MGASQDASPSLVRAPDGTYVGWVRTPADTSVTTWSAIVLSRATRAGVDHTPPDRQLADAFLYDASLAYDGSAVIAVYTHGSIFDSNTHFAIRQTVLDRVAEPRNAPGRSLDLSAAPFVDHGTIPVTIAYVPPMGTGAETGRFTFSCDGSYGVCDATGSMYDTVHFDGRAAYAGGEGRFFMSRANGTNTDLETRDGLNLAAVPNAQRIVSDFFARETGEFVTLTVVAPNAMSISRIDTASAVHVLVPDPVMTAGPIDEIAIAPDDRGGPAWLAALENSGTSIEVFAQDLASSGLISVSFAVPAAFARCQRLHVANFAGEPDLLAVVAQCGDSATGHILYWTVQRQPDVSADAGVDVVEVDTTPAIDIVPPQHGTGPSFRGSGCNCAVPGPRQAREPFGGMAFASLVLLAGLRRSRRRAGE